MAEAQVLVTRLIPAIDRADARRQVSEEPWIFAFPEGSTLPGKVIPLRSQHGRLTLLDHQIVGIAPFVQGTGDRLHSAARVPFVVTSLLTFQHPDKSALDMLIRLGTWLSKPATGAVIEYSEPAPVGAFDDVIKE